MDTSRKHWFKLIALFTFLGTLLIIKPIQCPSLWHDEGWVLSVASNWAKLGHYGHLMVGEPVPPIIMTSGFPVIASIAFSFRLFGIGLWQARLAGILFTVGAVGALYCLARRLYDRSIAASTLAVALLLSGYIGLHPVFRGRQALNVRSSAILTVFRTA